MAPYVVEGSVHVYVAQIVLVGELVLCCVHLGGDDSNDPDMHGWIQIPRTLGLPNWPHPRHHQM